FVSTARHLVVELGDGTFVIGPYYDHADDLGCASSPVVLMSGFRAGKGELVVARAVLHPHVDIAESGLMTSSGGDVSAEVLVCSPAAGRPKCPRAYAVTATTAMNEDELRAFQSQPRLRWP